jgi:hypothetical protein
MGTTPTRALRLAQRTQKVDRERFGPAVAGARERIMNMMCHIVTRDVKKKVTVGHWKLFQNMR